MAESSPWSDDLLKVVDAVPCGLLFVAPEGTITLANPAAEEMFGYPNRGLNGRGVDELVPPEVRASHAGHRRSFAGSTTGRTMGSGRVLHGVRKDGQPIAVEIGLSPSGGIHGLTIASVIDVSLTVANADGIAVISPDGEVLYANPAARELLGAEELRFPIPPLCGETLVVELEDPATGRRRWAEARLAEVSWKGRSSMLASLRDVTGRRELEEELHAQRRASLIGRLAGGVAHEFNNALQTILGAVEEARDKSNTPSAATLDSIQAAAEHSAALTRRLMAFGGVRFPGVHHVRIDHQIDEVVPMLQDLVGAEIEVLHRPCEKPLVVDLVPGQLDQVLLDLTSNARDAIGGPGRVEITVSEVPAGESACTCPTPKLDARACARIDVTDNGDGIPANLLGQVFDPFFSTKREGAAAGLGLAACRAIATRAGGHMCARSRPGEGSSVVLVLPLREDGAAAVTQSSTEHAAGADERILVVDDESMIRGLVRRQLERAGYEVTAVGNGPSALDLLLSGERYDLLVTDVVMPHMDGFELAGRAREIVPDLRVLFISGYSGSIALAERTATAGEIDLLSKPFEMKELTKRVWEALTREG